MGFAKGFQFGRYTEVEVRNYVTGEKTIIPNDFEIDFSFLKSVDEIESSSVGQVKIYGLTYETYQKIYSDGGEVELRCGYTNSEIKTLFVADILHMTQVAGNGTTETTISCSANILSHRYGGYFSANLTDETLMQFFDKMSRQLNIDININTKNVPKEFAPEYVEYFETASFHFDFDGSPQSWMGALCDALDFEVTHVPKQKGEMRAKNILSQRSAGVSSILNQIQNGYKKVERKPEVVSKIQSEEKVFNAIFITPESEELEALVLTNDTGLRKVSMEFKIATALETQELAANEEETQKSIDRRDKKAQKEALRKKKAEEKGKVFKPSKKKVSTIKVNRKSLKIVAALNPSARPQLNVLVKSVNENYNGIYIARSIEFNGNNKVGAWDMIISAEDTLGRYDTVNTSSTAVVDSESAEVTGELGNDTSYGATE